MDEKDWIILDTIYKERNITKASEKLYISQPALTYRIKQLEDDFNINILIRGKKGVEFTSEGEYLVQYANQMISDLRKVKEHLQNIDDQLKGTLRLGISSIFARYELPIILRRFLKLYPDIEVSLKTGWSYDIIHMMQKEEAHAGIVRGNYNWPGMKILLNTEKIYVVSSHEIDLKELPSLPRINYETDHTLKTIIDNWWQETYDIPPNYTMEVDRIDTCREMVKNGLGYAILPDICIKETGELFKVEISSPENQEKYSRQTWLIFRESALELSIVNAFVEYMKTIKKSSVSVK